MSDTSAKSGASAKPAQGAAGRWLNRLVPVMFVLSLVVVCFVVGAYVAEFEIPVYKKVLQPSFRGMRAMNEKRTLGDRRSHDWDVARNPKPGTTIYRPDKTYDGVTMFVSFGESPGARLISMDGEVIHQWNLPFREVWPDAPHVSKPAPEDRIHWHTAKFFPNGDLIANYVTAADTPYGYGLAKMDKDSNLIWRYSDCAHHDFDIDESGKVYALRHWIHHEEIDGAPHLNTPVLQDFVVVLNDKGEEEQRVSLYEAFAKSKFRHYLESIECDPRGDHTHSNGIDVLTKEFADKHDFCSPGDVLVSVRNPGILAIINLERGEVVWAAKGIWRGQHDPDPLDNGNIMVYDNHGSRAPGGKSRILEWNPSSGAVVWRYAGTEEMPFESVSRGSQQLLPNGNVLITESNNGRLLEVTRDQEVVWEYNNPHRYKKNNKNFVAVVCSAQRYAVDDLTFLAPEVVAKLKAKRAAAVAKKDGEALR